MLWLFGFVGQNRVLAESYIYDVIITEVQTGSQANASQEFVELYNPSDFDISINGWQLQYLSAANTDWQKPTRSIPLSGSIKAHQYLLVASKDYLTDIVDFSFSSILAQAGGHLRLIGNQASVQDYVAWGTALGGSSVVVAAGLNQTIVRSQDGQGNLILSENLSQAFSLSSQATPKADNIYAGPEQAVPSVEEETANTPIADQLVISELLPNPGSPATDDSDEFVELFNPNSYAVDLAGYRLTSGNSGSYSYTFTGGSLAAGSYLAVYSRQTKLTLSNTSGKVRLYGPDGSLLDETADYQNAKDNQVWAVIKGQWQWSTKATPAAANILAAVPPAKTATKSAAKTTKVKAASKTAAAKKTAASGTQLAGGDVAQSGRTVAGLNPLVLAGLGGLIVIYACYEYRQDLANRIQRLRAYRATRRATRELP